MAQGQIYLLLYLEACLKTRRRFGVCLKLYISHLNHDLYVSFSSKTILGPCFTFSLLHTLTKGNIGLNTMILCQILVCEIPCY